ncbi:hypothetical protein HPB52_010748 [Rhipicephalus sanguineus]|uniref:DDE Tnp4 domain-containing protein n=1 Tax=Rhipicephalus sanguineus TaxID=34632 RepID=A0A9D4PI85_RHISA|nr:hypothetical protein HPB52_010748 [Rhipicephalus sanguineus]
MPPEFKEKYSSTRVILDATEIQCEVPSSLSLQSTTYSPYKSSNTFKGLIGVLPNGLVAFVSELFTGSSSDRECVIRSGFLDLKFDDEDAVMADKGFRIEDLLEKNGVKLNLPPFLKSEVLAQRDCTRALTNRFVAEGGQKAPQQPLTPHKVDALRGILRKSNTYRKLEKLVKGHSFCLYGEPAYPLRSLLLKPYGGNVTAAAGFQQENELC